ncbi:MAG: ABC transporter ATP-binding protein [Flavobacteriales bacterium]
MVECKNIIKHYGDVKVLRGVNLSVNKGELVSIVGASGAGKTTLLKIIGTLERPDEGSININQTNLFSLPDNELSKFRNKHIGFVFQFHQLLPEFTALENVMLPALIGGTSKKEAEANAKEILNELGLSARLHHKPAALSGGEQQRVSVSRALINKPALILADEPSGNLDSANAEDLHRLFFDLRNKYALTFIIVTHNEKLAALTDRKLVMKDGVIIE